MKQNEIDKQDNRLKKSHDRFCRRITFSVRFAPDFLKSYGDPVLKEHIDFDHLQEAPTTHISEALKEIIADGSLAARLLDPQSMSEVLLHLEHKSKPSQTVAVQLLADVALSLRSRWLLSGRPESGAFVPPIPLMVVVYNGNEDWKGEIWFQDLFPNLPEKFRPFVPQFQVFLINLRRFKYGELPGRPETQAIVESMMRATDGTFAEHLPNILKRVAEAGLDEHLQLDLTRSILFYSIYAGRATSDQITNAVTTAFTGEKGIIMVETINNSILLEGIERGRVEEKINDILEALRIRHKQVPDSIVNELKGRTDLIALKSIFEAAIQCDSIGEFAEALK